MTRQINLGNRGNNSIDKALKGGDKINTVNTNDKISTELWMEHFANALVNQNAIDEKTYKKLIAKINAEVNRRYNVH